VSEQEVVAGEEQAPEAPQEQQTTPAAMALVILFLLIGALLGAVLPVLGVVVIAAFNAFYWLPIRGESPRPRPS
jgi:hypothetical protein